MCQQSQRSLSDNPWGIERIHKLNKCARLTSNYQNSKDGVMGEVCIYSIYHGSWVLVLMIDSIRSILLFFGPMLLPKAISYYRQFRANSSRPERPIRPIPPAVSRA